MAQQVINPGQQRTTLDELGQAVGIASNIFGVILDAKQKSKLADIEKRKTELAGKQELREFQAETQPAFKPDRPGLIKPEAFPEGALALPEGAVGRVPVSVVQQEKTLEKKERDQARALAKTEKTAATLANKTQFEQQDKLSDDYRKDSTDSIKSVAGFKRLEAAALNPNPTGATDLALIFGFMKTVDPGSTVREGEFANAENSQGVESKIRTLYNKIREGQRLTPESRNNFFLEGKRGLQAQLETQGIIDKRYTDIADNFGLDARFIVNPQFKQMQEQFGELVRRGQEQETAVAGQQPSGFGLIPEAKAETPFDPDRFLLRGGP